MPDEVSFVRFNDSDSPVQRPRNTSSFIAFPYFTPKYKTRNAVICIVIFVLVVATLVFVIIIIGKKGFRSEREEISDDASSNSSIYRSVKKSSALNVLFIIVDDLRPTLSCYGDPIAVTPNIDQLADRGFLFLNTFSQQAFCAPSRTSLLTSRRPDSTRLYDSGSYWRDATGNFTTLPQHFKENGYYTYSVGKVFHKGVASNFTDDYPYSWSEIPFHPITDKYKMAKVCPTFDGHLHANLICPVDVKSQPMGTLPDIESTERSVDFLRNYAVNQKLSEKPFFLAVGYHKPHIPFKFPRDYLDLYPVSSMTLAPNRTLPKKLPLVAWSPWTDVRSRDDVSSRNVSFPYGPLSDDLQKLSRQGYYASVSYVDDLIGRLLQTLEETHLSSKTMVILVGDHGWSLGEHQEWAKYSNFEVATRVPLIVSSPQLVTSLKPFAHVSLRAPIRSQGRKRHEIKALTELTDLFPTLSELAGLSVPPLCPSDGQVVPFCTEGVSLVPLLTNTVVRKSERQVHWKSAVFWQYPRPSESPQENSDSPDLRDIKFMGYAIRTKLYRYTEWVTFDPTVFSANWTDVHARELYRLDSDPQENENIASDPKYQGVVREMAVKLRKGWRSSLPSGY